MARKARRTRLTRFDEGRPLPVPDEQRSDDELITLLSDEYQTALSRGDRDRIDNEIAPRFWARFATRFDAYKVMWDDPEREAHPDHEARYILDEAYLGKVQADWMDRVLRGEIVPGDEVDEETSEY